MRRHTSAGFVECWHDTSSCVLPQAVLICGWREEAFMSDMLREMDHGPSALPAGSQLTLFNTSTNVEIMARVKTRNRFEFSISNPHNTVLPWA